MPLSDLLREAASYGQYGHARKPNNYYLPDPANPGAAYWARQTAWRWRDLDDDTVLRLCTLSRRYLRYYNLARNVWPQWTEVRRIHWADNSTDVVERDKHGNERTRQLVGPGGDACF